MHILPRPTRSLISPTLREWAQWNLGVTVWTWLLLSRSTMQLSWLTLTGAMLSIPHHLLKGLGFKKGVCCQSFMHETSQSETPPVPSLEFKGASVAPSKPFLRVIWMHKQCHVWLLLGDAKVGENYWAAPSAVILQPKIKCSEDSDESAYPFVPTSNSPSCWSRSGEASLHTSIPAPGFRFFLCLPVWTLLFHHGY